MPYPNELTMTALISATTETALNGVVTPKVTSVDKLISDLGNNPILGTFNGKVFKLIGIISSDKDRITFLGQTDEDKLTSVFCVYKKHPINDEELLEAAEGFSQFGFVEMGKISLQTADASYAIEDPLETIRVGTDDIGKLEELLDGQKGDRNATAIMAKSVNRIVLKDRDYEVLAILGHGGRGVVYLVRYINAESGDYEVLAVKVHYELEDGIYESKAHRAAISRVGAKNIVEVYPGDPLEADFIANSDQRLGRGTVMPVRFLRGTTLADLNLDNIPPRERLALIQQSFKQLSNVTDRARRVSVYNLDLVNRNVYIVRDRLLQEEDDALKMIDLGEVAFIKHDAEVIREVLTEQITGDLQESLLGNFYTQISALEPTIRDKNLNIVIFEGMQFMEVWNYLQNVLNVPLDILAAACTGMDAVTSNKSQIKHLIGNLLRDESRPLSKLLDLISEVRNLAAMGLNQVARLKELDLTPLCIASGFDTWFSNAILDNGIEVDWASVLNKTSKDKLNISHAGTSINSPEISNPAILLEQVNPENPKELAALNAYAFMAGYFQKLTNHFHMPLSVDGSLGIIPMDNLFTKEFMTSLITSVANDFHFHQNHTLMPESVFSNSPKLGMLTHLTSEVRAQILEVFNKFFQTYYSSYVLKKDDQVTFNVSQIVDEIDNIIKNAPSSDTLVTVEAPIIADVPATAASEG